MRSIQKKVVSNNALFAKKLLQWSKQFREVVFLDSNMLYNEQQEYSQYDCVLAVDAFTTIQTDYKNAFEDLHEYQSRTQDWLFGYLSYDLKNDTQHLSSNHFDGLEFPDLFFFQPKKLFLLKGNLLEIQYLYLCDDEMNADFNAINDQSVLENNDKKNTAQQKILIQQRIPKESYIKKVSTMLSHIYHGTIYEANFCMDFFAEKAVVNPWEIYNDLNDISATPFSVFLKNSQQYLLCASPERYIQKNEQTIISQPIKGTAKRFDNAEQDAKSKLLLGMSEKERSENIMIVDLVRNDLSHTAAKGSVTVTELCQIYSFKQVHQMISTITAQVAHTVSPIQIIKTTFPMGSMTGAPKISAMKIIEELEETKRGLYSGAVGYFKPNGDFDFNVVIRSILYNAKNQYLSFSVGSAITASSIPENEYEECLLKASAMFTVLQ